jgi:hypothetical protein
VRVAVDGSGSTDAEDDDLSYAWKLLDKPSGGAAALDADDEAIVHFTPDKAGPYVVRLVVDDGEDESAPVTVTLTARPARVLVAGDAFHSALADRIEAEFAWEVDTPVILDGTADTSDGTSTGRPRAKPCSSMRCATWWAAPRCKPNPRCALHRRETTDATAPTLRLRHVFLARDVRPRSAILATGTSTRGASERAIPFSAPSHSAFRALARAPSRGRAVRLCGRPATR